MFSIGGGASEIRSATGGGGMADDNAEFPDLGGVAGRR